MAEASDMGQDRKSSASASLLTFLLADVRGYTRFTAEQGDTGAARLADRFAALCEEVLAEHSGHVLELRGDEAMAVFSSARNALRGAVALQRAFELATRDDPSLPLRVGMGLDAGEPIPLRGGYRGGALNLAARLCSIAGAGEILASEGVIHLARRTEGLTFVDRGEVVLKGLPAPVRVLQVASEGEIPAQLPPLQPILVAHPTNLPDEPTPFIGREDEIAAITALLRDPHIRLLTLTGAGGTGKTRLALQVGSAVLYEYRDGVFFCDLSPLDASIDVLPAVAQVLQVQDEGGRNLTDTLIEHLEQKHFLLILDNFEHLTDAGQVIAHLLDACRELHVLVTSRVPLHLSRENEYPVPPLRVPDLEHLPTLQDLVRHESIALFIQQARAARPGFTITDENAVAVAEICARLDGLPLAIELAAARIKLFPPQALLQRLSNRLSLLTGGARDRPTKQQTLRGAIEWSYALLTEVEQLLFARLAVFSGGWTFEAAEAICTGDDDLDLVEAMGSLVDKSLVRQEGRDEPRFSMLETIREYAVERLNASGEVEEVRERHAVFHLKLAEEAESHLQSEEQETWIDRLETDRDNLRAALAWFLERHEVERELRLAGALEYYWRAYGRFREGSRWLDTGLALAGDVPVTVRMKALNCAGGLALIVGDQTRVVAVMEELLQLAQEHGNSVYLRNALSLLAVAAYGQGDHPRAAQYLEENLSSARADGSQNDLARALLDLGLARSEEGCFPDAITLVEEARTLFAMVGNVNWETVAVGSLGYVRLLQGAWRQAKPLFVEYLKMAQHIRDPLNLAAGLEGLAACATQEGEVSHAVRLFAAARVVREETGSRLLSPRNHAVIQAAMASARERLTDDAWRAVWEEGRSMPLDEVAAVAVGGGAGLHAPEGR